MSVINQKMSHRHYYKLKYKFCVSVCYLKLLSELRGVALRVNLQHLLVDESKLINRDGSLSAQASLQDGIMDEHVLLLGDRMQGKYHKFTKSQKTPHCTYEFPNC